MKTVSLLTLIVCFCLLVLWLFSQYLSKSPENDCRDLERICKNMIEMQANALDQQRIQKAKEVCTPNLCKNGGSCYVSESGSEDYYCKCPFPMGGKNCTELEHGSESCYQNGSLVICIYVAKDSTFEEGQSYCEKKNMSLVKIPDKKTQDFIIEVLARTTHFSLHWEHFFYIGLQRENEDSLNFHWTDGSPLGNYQPWSRTVDHGTCVGMNYWSAYEWKSCSCDSIGQLHTYFICGRNFADEA